MYKSIQKRTFTLFAFAVLLSGCLAHDKKISCPASSGLAPQERLITILGTNDIHGGIEPETAKDGSASGGMAFWSGAIRSIREGLATKFGACSGTVVVDAGDQFQGSLLSNYNEGSLMFDTMNSAGYDAVVPGNHDYDFGPLGWLQDRVTPGYPDQNPRGVIEGLARSANFPLLSANTYLRDSLTDAGGNPVDADGVGCRPTKSGDVIEFALAKRPAFLRPYVIKNVAGVRVALIGLDNAATPKVTTVENVSDLCFRDEFETYKDLRAELEGKADVFVLIIHNGDAGGEKSLTHLIERLTALSDRTVDAVIAGHTHFVNNVMVNGVPGIQSGSGGVLFGRVDLVWDSEARAVRKNRTNVFAGVRMLHEGCEKRAAFCSALPSASGVAYETIPVMKDARIQSAIEAERSRIAPLAERKLGFAAEKLTRDRIFESPLADALTDAFRAASGADVAFLNTGGIREDIREGEITYEGLFAVLPFGNHAIVTKPAPLAKILALLERSARSCGGYGPLMQSGLRVQFTRDCENAGGSVDPNAQLMRVETVAGEVLLDRTAGIEPDPSRKLVVATLDYLMSGGAGYDDFKSFEPDRDTGILRETLASAMEKNHPSFDGTIDGRWKQVHRKEKE